MNKVIALILGSVAGGLSRYYLAGWVHRFTGSDFPFGTLIVNLSGCFLIGFLASLGEDKLFLGSQGSLLLTVGFCGAFTTFSTFMFETNHLVTNGENLRAFINIAASIGLGFLVFRLGTILGKII